MISLPRSGLSTDSLSASKMPVPDLRGMRMIIAEDDQYGFEYLQQLFKRTGVEVRHAKHGIHLIQLLDEQLSDIVMLDIHMPEMDGYECLREIRMKQLNTIVIIQSASDVHDDRDRSLSAGADGYISKPIRKNELFFLIETLLRKREF